MQAPAQVQGEAFWTLQLAAWDRQRLCRRQEVRWVRAANACIQCLLLQLQQALALASGSALELLLPAVALRPCS